MICEKAYSISEDYGSLLVRVGRPLNDIEIDTKSSYIQLREESQCSDRHTI